MFIVIYRLHDLLCSKCLVIFLEMPVQCSILYCIPHDFFLFTIRLASYKLDCLEHFKTLNLFGLLCSILCLYHCCFFALVHNQVMKFCFVKFAPTTESAGEACVLKVQIANVKLF